MLTSDCKTKPQGSLGRRPRGMREKGRVKSSGAPQPEMMLLNNL